MALAGIAGGLPAAVRCYPLDERTVYTIRIGTEEPTTCVFPGAIAALEAANLSAKAEETPPVLLSHRAGTNYFSVRALKAAAMAAANVVLDGHVYVLRFEVGEDPDRAVTFRANLHPGSAESWHGLLGRARSLEQTTAVHPLLKPTVECAQPGTVTSYRDFSAVVEAVFRFDAEDALVIRVRLENPRTAAVNYDPEGFAVRHGRDIYPAALAEASGVIPPGGTAFAWLVVAGSPAGGRADLPVNLPFNVIVARLP